LLEQVTNILKTSNDYVDNNSIQKCNSINIMNSKQLCRHKAIYQTFFQL